MLYNGSHYYYPLTDIRIALDGFFPFRAHPNLTYDMTCGVHRQALRSSGPTQSRCIWLYTPPLALARCCQRAYKVSYYLILDCSHVLIPTHVTSSHDLHLFCFIPPFLISLLLSHHTFISRHSFPLIPSLSPSPLISVRHDGGRAGFGCGGVPTQPLGGCTGTDPPGCCCSGRGDCSVDTSRGSVNDPPHLAPFIYITLTLTLILTLTLLF